MSHVRDLSKHREPLILLLISLQVASAANQRR